MSLSKLSIAFKCLNSIGNSTDLNIMIGEFVRTFVKQSDATSGKFFLKKPNSLEELITVGKRIDYQLIEYNEEYSVNSIDKKIQTLSFNLKNGLLVFFYNHKYDLDLNTSILESLENKLNLSIESCLNVELLKNQNKELKEKKDKLKKLTEHLQDEISIATKENIEKEKQLYDQLKMAQMGELIGNIAHQWRQPLSVISTAASGMEIKKEMNMLTDYDFKEYTKSIIQSSDYLSNTIEEFREYINESHKVKEIVVQDRLSTALKMVDSSFSVNNINIIKGRFEEEKIYFRLILGELLQVLISILNNSKDALISNGTDHKWVKYELYRDIYNITITIEDNAGGIDKSIIDKIFNPYFTTKHKGQGTGIGLYSAYDIVVNKLNGRLYVKNTSHGAKFFIELPCNLDYVI